MMITEHHPQCPIGRSGERTDKDVCLCDTLAAGPTPTEASDE